MLEEKKKFFNSIKFPFLSLFICIFLKIIEYTFNLNFIHLGILPRKTFGLLGIVTAPFVHASLEHLYSNAVPLVVLGTAVFYFYPSISKRTVISIYFITDILVWIFARESFHVGASGIVYGLFSFLFFSGIFKKDKRATTLSMLTIFLYGGMAYGIFPTKEWVSWESHLFGFITGIFIAYIFRKKDIYKKYDWEDEELDVDVRELKVLYKKD